MSKIIHNLLQIAIILTLVGAVYLGFQYVDSYTDAQEPSSNRSFTVSAEGEVTAVPDIAEFTFSVITEGKTDLSKLQTQNTEKTNKVIEFLKSKNVDAKDIKTQYYNIEPQYQYYNCTDGGICPPPSIVGYLVNNTVSVKIRDFKESATLLSGVVDNGANSVSQFNFTIDDRTELENQAREKAIEKAKTKAKAIADAGGFEIGDLLSISESGGYFPPTPYYAMESAVKMDAGFGGAGPVVEPGSEDVKVTVTLTYEID